MVITEINEWHYDGKPFTKEDASAKIEEGIIGFIYEITDNKENKKYIGKKLLVSKRRLPPLKGKTRKRVKMVESDWQKYFGSSDLVKELAEERTADFTRRILMFCRSKGELNYREAEMQFALGVLLSDEFYNNFIGVKIHGKHVNSLRKSD